MGFLVLQCFSKSRFARYLRAIFQKTVILKLGLPVSILSADVRTLNGKQFGQMLIELPEDPVVRKTAMEYLRAQGVTAEEVHG